MKEYISKIRGRLVFAYIVGTGSIMSLILGLVLPVLYYITSERTYMNLMPLGYSFFVLLGLVFLFCVGAGYLSMPKQLKNTMKRLTEQGLLEQAQKEFDQIPEKKYFVAISQHFIYFKYQGMVIPIKDIVWMYISRTNLSQGFGPGSGFNFRFYVYDMNGNEYTAVYTYDEKNLKYMERVFYTAKKLNDKIMLGYSKEIEKQYKELYKKKK